MKMKGGKGLEIDDNIGPFIDMMEKQFPKQAARTVDSGLYYLRKESAKDLKRNVAGDMKLPPLQKLKRKKGDFSRYAKAQGKGGTRNTKRTLKAMAKKKSGQYTGLASQRRAEAKGSKRTTKGLANAIRYVKYSTNPNKAAVGWVFSNGADQKKMSKRGIYYQTGGTDTVTPKMRRFFAGARGIILKKGTHTISRPHRDIWNNVHRKYVLGGHMQKVMEEKLVDKIERDAKRAKIKGDVVT